jgi:hypothetical protein
MQSGSLRLSLAAATLLFVAAGAQAQHAAGPANHPLPTTAQFTARVAADAAQAEALALAPNGQPELTLPDPVTKPRARPFDPNSIHYPYGRASLGNIDPSSAANPYGPYARDPGYAGPAPLPSLRVGRPGRAH